MRRLLPTLPMPVFRVWGLPASSSVGMGLIWTAIGLAALTAGGQLRTARAQVQSEPMPVLSDTEDYCDVLERHIVAHRNLPAEVTQLLHEGHQLCDHGQVRDGIAHLRRALMILKHRPGNFAPG